MADSNLRWPNLSMPAMVWSVIAPRLKTGKRISLFSFSSASVGSGLGRSIGISRPDDEIASLIAADAALSRRHQILTSIAGVGALTAKQLTATMPELGCLEGKQAASLAGLAPVARQSGQWKGKSFIRGRQANVRQALYMPALVVARYNPYLEAKYQQLIAGQPAKIAITAVMRKTVITPNALLKADRRWQQSLA